MLNFWIIFLTLTASLVHTYAQATNLTADIRCDCAAWQLGKNGQMELGRSPSSTESSDELSDSFNKIVLEREWTQRASQLQGFISMTPADLNLMFGIAKVFKSGTGGLEYVSKECKNRYAKMAGNVACGVSITFPINEKAKELNSK